MDNNKSRKEKFTENLAIFGILLLIILLISLPQIASFVQERREINEWNNGKCRICGSELEFKQVAGHRYTSSFIYGCKNGHTLELNNMPKERNLAK